MAEPLGIALLGCGYWGINYIRVCNELTQSRVVTVCDQNSERLQEIGRRFPEIELTSQVDEALRVDGVDAAILSTPASTHFDIAHRCLLAGKHVLVEKPLTTTVADAEKLIALAAVQQLTLMVGHTFLYNTAVRKVKELIEQSAAGRLYYLYAQRTNLGPVRHDVNALWDLATHDISIFNYLLDSMPMWVSAVGAKVLRNGHEDVGFVSLGYPDDVLAHIHVSWADPNKVREVVVVGSNNRIVFNDINMLEPVRIFDKGVAWVPDETTTYGEYQLLIRDGDIISPRIQVSEPLKSEVTHFIECILQKRPPLTNGEVGRNVVAVMEAIDRSIALHGVPVTINSYDYSKTHA